MRISLVDKVKKQKHKDDYLKKKHTFTIDLPYDNVDNCDNECCCCASALLPLTNDAPYWVFMRKHHAVVIQMENYFSQYDVMMIYSAELWMYM